jgi:hypothetical protein
MCIVDFTDCEKIQLYIARADNVDAALDVLLRVGAGNVQSTSIFLIRDALIALVMRIPPLRESIASVIEKLSRLYPPSYFACVLSEM